VLLWRVAESSARQVRALYPHSKILRCSRVRSWRPRAGGRRVSRSAGALLVEIFYYLPAGSCTFGDFIVFQFGVHEELIPNGNASNKSRLPHAPG
jgi:hypothetical protein